MPTPLTTRTSVRLQSGWARYCYSSTGTYWGTRTSYGIPGT